MEKNSKNMTKKKKTIFHTDAITFLHEKTFK